MPLNEDMRLRFMSCDLVSDLLLFQSYIDFIDFRKAETTPPETVSAEIYTSTTFPLPRTRILLVRVLFSEAHSLTGLDLRDPSTIPLNFTKSINLAISERGINAMRHAGQPGLLDHVMSTTIPMRGRMIHGRGPTGALFEQSQDYDVKGRVCLIASTLL